MSDVYGIVYAEGSKAILRIVVSDDPDYDYRQHANEGEAVLVADAALGRDLHAARVALWDAFAIDPPEPLAALVDRRTGLVTAMVMADPVLASYAGHDLIPAYAGVATGQIYDRPTDTFIAPDVYIPAGVAPNGTPYPEQFIPAHPVPKP